MHTHRLLNDLVTPRSGQLNDTVPSDSGEDGSGQRRRFDGLALDDEDVAGGHLLKVSVGLGVEVDNIRISVLLGLKLSHQHGRVVASGFGATHSSRGSAVETLLDDEVNGGKLTSLEIRTDGSGINTESIFGRRAKAENGTSTHEERAEVETTLAMGRDEIGIFTDNGGDGINELSLGNGGHTHTGGTGGEALGVFVGTEKEHATVLDAALGLHTLKNGLTIVEDLGGWVHG
mmetsp:Transcript_9780/g.18266  ORF Transcript_9780/g.18266 Transcript_9780/m.18266 type:complete len:232 (+) Transcript_9780:231-926(+)